MKSISLMKDWTLREEPLSTSPAMASLVTAKKDDWMVVPSLPCDIHVPLMEAGKIKEPTVAENSYDCEWTEKRSWWFKKTFTLKAEDISPHGVELFIEMLDIHADLFLNGVHIGHHNSAFYPFCKDVNPWLKEGENELLIRLSTGLEYAETEGFEVIRPVVACEWRYRRAGRGEERRAMLRKPQYVFGWDQAVRAGTCAICGDVRLDVLDEIVVRDIRFETRSLSDEGAKILAEVEVESRCLNRARNCVVTLTMEKDGKVVHTETQEYMSQTGTNFRDFSFTLKNPELWWPNGYGEQNLYTVKVTAENHLGAKDEKSIVTGVRTLELDTSLVEEDKKSIEDERHYTFVVNGKRLYCKGMDFIHTDAFYARVTDEQQENLLKAAKDANFCMLRFWDGNLYQTDAVYEICDKFGFLVIQNFLFACAAYPDHVDTFNREVEKEARYHVKRLRSHPSLAIWYGNGESLSILSAYNGTPAIPGTERKFLTENNRAIYTGGAYLVGELLPRIVHELSHTAYQCTTPFGGYDSNTCPERGSTHFYPFLNLNPEYQQKRISVETFDELKTHFIAECGVMGVPSAEAYVRYLGGDTSHYYNDDSCFEHHRNTFERYAVRDGIYKHFTGEKALSFEEYCLYGGLFQGVLLEYAADHIRHLPNCGGSVLWCFNDSYGEVGFSLMDHEGDPKPAYYFLSRAYEANRIIMRNIDGVAHVYCCNSAPTPCKMDIVCGYVGFDGTYGKSVTMNVDLPAFAPATLIGTMPVADLDLVNGIVYARVDGREELTAILRSGDFRTLNITRKANLTMSDVKETKDELSFTVTADIFAYAVNFGTPAAYRFSDQFFHLLPGESKRITLKNPGSLKASDIKLDCVCVK